MDVNARLMIRPWRSVIKTKQGAWKRGYAATAASQPVVVSGSSVQMRPAPRAAIVSRVRFVFMTDAPVFVICRLDDCAGRRYDAGGSPSTAGESATSQMHSTGTETAPTARFASFLSKVKKLDAAPELAKWSASANSSPRCVQASA